MSKQKLKLRCQNCEQLYEVEWDTQKELPLTGYCCSVCYPEVTYYNGKEIMKDEDCTICKNRREKHGTLMCKFKDHCTFELDEILIKEV